MKKKRDLVYKSTLKSRFGLTDSLIKKLGKPDETCPNPHYLSGPPAGLFIVKRVEKFVKKHQKEVDDAAAKRGRRKEAAAKAVQTKTARTVGFARKVRLEFDPLPEKYGELRDMAYMHAIDRHGGDAHEPGPSGVAAFVRHNFTNYEYILDQFHGQVGGGEAYEALRTRLDKEVNRHISESYRKKPKEVKTAETNPTCSAQSSTTPPSSSDGSNASPHQAIAGR